MKRVVKSGLLAVVSVAAMTVGLAQDAGSPDQAAQAAAETRQGLQKLMGFEMAPLGDMLKGKKPFDAAFAVKAFGNIQALAGMQADVFAFDTRKFTVKTKAREGIWTNKADFDAKSNDLNKASADAVAAAKTGDKGMTMKAIGAMGKACGSCHDSFRDK